MPRHNFFSNSEMADMVAIYSQQNFNDRAAARSYADTYPNRRQPNRTLFSKLFARLRESGSFRPKRHHGAPIQRTVEQEEAVLNIIENDPLTSIRRISNNTGLSRGRISFILHEQQLHPFHYTPVQNLLARDYLPRQRFCEFVLRQQRDDPSFVSKILFTDEATFTRRGILNRKNEHIWADENPFANRDRHFQQEYKINVWFGIIDDTLVGPLEFPTTLNGQDYLNFLRNDLNNLLEEVPLNIRANMWFLQDGAPPHYAVAVRNHLNNVFPHRWIGRGSEHPWPQRSPDLNAMDFFFWGHFKTRVYSVPINTRDELWQRIIAVANEIRNLYPSFFQVRRNFLKRCRKCIEVGGGHFENLL